MAVGLFAICVISIGCSSTSIEPTEERLIERSEMANDALNTQDWASIYHLYPPEVQDICSLANFEISWNDNYEEHMRALVEFLGTDTELTLVVETNSITITETNAYVTLELDAFNSDGRRVIENLVNDGAQAWEFINGEWFIGEDIPEAFC